MGDEVKKCYICNDTYSQENWEIYFADSNIQARKWFANEHNDGELGGIRCVRAPGLDKYKVAHEIPVRVLIDMNWHFECYWSGIEVNYDLYDNEGYDGWNFKEKKYEWIEFKNKEPIGFYNRPVFACKEWEEEYYEEKKRRKEFEDGWFSFYERMILNRLPDAKLIYDSEKYGQRRHAYSERANKVYCLSQMIIPFAFPGMKHWASLELRREPCSVSFIGPIQPKYYCANGDKETFEKWAEEQKKLFKSNGSDS